jgi:hypothetical protein
MNDNGSVFTKFIAETSEKAPSEPEIVGEVPRGPLLGPIIPPADHRAPPIEQLLDFLVNRWPKPAYASARLRLPPGERWTRYAGTAGVPWAQEHPAHGSLHRAGADQVQGLVEGLTAHPTELGGASRQCFRESKNLQHRPT